MKDKYIRIPLMDIQEVPTDNGLYALYANQWWVVDDAGNVLFYKTLHHPQCNKNKSIAESISKITGSKIVLIESAWVTYAYKQEEEK